MLLLPNRTHLPVVITFRFKLYRYGYEKDWQRWKEKKIIIHVEWRREGRRGRQRQMDRQREKESNITKTLIIVSIIITKLYQRQWQAMIITDDDDDGRCLLPTYHRPPLFPLPNLLKIDYYFILFLSFSATVGAICPPLPSPLLPPSKSTIILFYSCQFDIVINFKEKYKKIKNT